MAVEFYLAFQANGCLVHEPPGQEEKCDNIIHANLISGMNIILIFLVVRVMLFKLGDLTITRTLHLTLRPYEVRSRQVVDLFRFVRPSFVRFEVFGGKS